MAEKPRRPSSRRDREGRTGYEKETDPTGFDGAYVDRRKELDEERDERDVRKRLKDISPPEGEEGKGDDENFSWLKPKPKDR